MPEQREIKFRAWDKREGLQKMYYLNGFVKYGEGWSGGNPAYKFYALHFGDKGFMSADAKDFEIMQYTGLKDKNGKEIYEGDIIKLASGHITEIFFRDAGYKITSSIGDVIQFMNAIAKHSEVTGNIYENANLLTHA